MQHIPTPLRLASRATIAIALSLSASGALAVPFSVPDQDVGALRQAILDANANTTESTTIVLPTNGRYEFTESFDGRNALPPITSRVILQGNGSVLRRSNEASEDFRLMFVEGPGDVELSELALENGSLMGVLGGVEDPSQGGAIYNCGRLLLEKATFTDNRVFGNGGAIFNAPAEWCGAPWRFGSEVTILDSDFHGNQSWFLGGAISNWNFLFIRGTRFWDNVAGEGDPQFVESGGAILNEGVLVMDNSLLYDNLGTFGAGAMDTRDLVFINSSTIMDNRSPSPVATGGLGRSAVSEDDETWMFNTLIVGNEGQNCDQTSPSSDAEFVVSLGFNATDDATCGLSEPSDMAIQHAGMIFDPHSLLPFALTNDSPLVDSGPELCNYKDLHGRGRPQDGNGDGVWECDVGAIELANGPEIGASQTGLYFDPDSPGQGIFLEMLVDQRAQVTWFSLDRQGIRGAWYEGEGVINGNSVIVDRLLMDTVALGDEVVSEGLRAIGSLSMIFSNCESTDAPGRVNFSPSLAPQGDDTVFGFLNAAKRLSQVGSCGASQASPQAARTGTFTSSSDKISVVWSDNGDPVVLWRTRSRAGDPIWLISGSVAVDGASVEATMLAATADEELPEFPAGFGGTFDPARVHLEPAGTLSIRYESCDELTVEFDQNVEGTSGIDSHDVRAFDRQHMSALGACDI